MEEPVGLRYEPGLLSASEEQALVERFEALEFGQVVIHGQAARRTVRLFGYDYDFQARSVSPTEPVPQWLDEVRQRGARLAELDPQRLVQALISRYPPAATIGWHRDAPAFGPTVVGVSLLSDCVMRFQRRVSGERRVYELPLARRSGYALSKAARSSWQHSIPAVATLRYSITFRTLRVDAGPR
ncbi:MAG TPA: alpha-ketoglutarate-dependent dioxygenase AlkB [Egibacteraceae bacterium]|nr:alpha-ketoglutarate-dependent dioxygenase AlkB [Egibacteraceae bacterium]